jgi:hypothetical protein
LRSEGEFLGSPKSRDDYKPTRGDRADVKKPKDNLRPEGEFTGQKRDEFTAIKGARAPIKKPEDNLRPEGDFTGKKREEFTATIGERAPMKKPEDNLKPEGEFIGKKRDEFTATKGERSPIKKPEDNLKPEGDFTGERKNEFTVVRGDRADIKKPDDNLKTGGQFTGQRKTVTEFTGERGERPPLIRRNTWTKLEGEIFVETTSRSEFREFEVVERTEKVRRRSDNLVVGGGEFQVRHSYCTKRLNAISHDVRPCTLSEKRQELLKAR